MFVVDANVLLYAVNADSAHHDAARTWLDDALVGSAGVGMPWVVLLAFLRIVTSSRLLPRPLSVADALQQVDDWVQAPPAVIVNPTNRHLSLLGGLLGHVRTGGNLVNDASIGALAVEHNATVVSFDRDFTRFEGVKLLVPA